MFGLKKHLIKSMIKIEVVENKPGILKLRTPQIIDLDEEYRVYDHFGVEAIKLLNGIETINVDYNSQIITITYNANVVTAPEIFKWIDIVIDVGLDYKDFIKDNWETKLDYVWDKMKGILEKKLETVKN